MHTRNIQLLATAMYKARNRILPCSLSEFVTPREITYDVRKRSDFLQYNTTSVDNGTETFSYLGPKIWEVILRDIKESPSHLNLKIKDWTTDECPCRLCKVFLMNIGFL